MSIEWLNSSTAKHTLDNGNVILYSIVNGTAYHASTNTKVIEILEDARLSTMLLRLSYGDTDTGRDWGEVHDIVGRVGRSTGEIKIPILLNHKNSLDGGGILDHCIVRIEMKYGNEKAYREVYRHPKYHTSSMIEDLCDNIHQITI
jgi:hypothetical protein